MEDISIDNILAPEDADNLFLNADDSTEQDLTKEIEETEKTENKTTEVDADDLFDGPESVGSEEDDKKVKEDTTLEDVGNSPNKFYSSIAKALIEEGIFPDLDNEAYSKIKSPEDFRNLVEQQIQAGLEEKQRRIDRALNAGVETDVIKQYENTVSYLDNINEDTISDENQEGENLRKLLIYQDYINRGFSKERALKEVLRSLDNGTDIDDAKESLKSNIEFFKDKYKQLVSDKEKEAEEYKQNLLKQADNLKNSILNDKNVFGDLSLDKTTKQKIYDNIAKPVYKDPDTGSYYTAILKYEKENKIDFLKNISLVFTLTDGFKNFDGLVKGKVRKEVKKGLRELENTLNNTARTSDGSLKFSSGVYEDPESFIGKGWKLDI